jgi:hypothetical protein
MMILPDIVREDIHDVIIKVKEALTEMNAPKIKDLSNHTIHNASIFQDNFSITVATAIYSLGKIVENERLRRQHPKEWERFLKKVNIALDDIRDCSSDKECTKLDERIKALIKIIASADERFTEYVGFVMEKAKTKKGAEMYRHGISLSKAADVLGISLWELMDYVGKTKINEEPANRSALERFNKAKEFFG